MATPPNIVAWEIPWTEEPAGYSPWGYKRVRYNLAIFPTQGLDPHLLLLLHGREILTTLPPGKPNLAAEQQQMRFYVTFS